MADISAKLFRIAKLPPEDMRAELLELAAAKQKEERRLQVGRNRTKRYRERHGERHGDGDCNVTVSVTENASILTLPIHTLSISKKVSIQANSPKRGSRLPDDWEPSLEDRRFAHAAGMSDTDIDREAANFVDYWTAVPGAKGTKLNWPATWRNRIRSIATRRPTKISNAQHNEELRARLSAIAERLEDQPQVRHQLGAPDLGLVSPDPESYPRISGYTGKLTN